MIRSGRPQRIVTDPGSQLKSFNEKQKVAESQGIYEDFINTINEDIVDTVTKQLAKLKVEFCTTIPKAPWRTGAIESLVKQFKETLRCQTIGKSYPMTSISHQNWMTQIIGTINSRPLCLFPDNTQIKDKFFITPNSLSDGSFGGELPQLITPSYGQK